MNPHAAIAAALEQAGLCSRVRSTRDFSGGCIHRVLEVTLDDGERVVAKLNVARCRSLFEEEAHGLRVLASANAVIVPRPLAVSEHEEAAVLLMTWIPAAPANAASWCQFGEDLASLHLFEMNADRPPRYGFDIDNHLGSTPQPNEWREDWVEFNAVNRLGFQLRTARNAGLLSDDESRRIEEVIRRLDRLIPRHPRPSLIHGDLWSGNVLPTESEHGPRRRRTCAVIDPACSIGDGWADIAMMRLFGGFPPECFEAYFSRMTRGDSGGTGGSGDLVESIEMRIAVYQLYHVLNHVNIFGRGYAGQAMSLAAKLGA